MWASGSGAIDFRGRGLPVRLLLVSILLLALAGCDAKKKIGGKKTPCEDATTAQQLIKRARKLTAGGDHGAALRCLEAGSRRFEASGDLWQEYGALSEDMGMRHEALEMLERAVSLKPTLGLASLRLGNMYAALNDDDRAIRFFKKASKARPDSPVPFNNIGLAHMRNGRTQEALDTFKNGMDATPEGAYGRSMILNNLGLLLKQLGNLEEAVESFQLALQSEPSVEAACNLASILIDVGNYEEAYELCAGVLEKGHREKLVVELAVSALALLDRIHDAAALLAQIEQGASDMDDTSDMNDRPAQPKDLDVPNILNGAIDRLSAAGQPMAAVDLLAFMNLHSPRHFVRAAQLLTEAHQREEQRLALRAYATALRLAHEHGGSSDDTEAEVQVDAGTRPVGSFKVQALRGASLLLYQMTRYGDAEAVFRRMLAETEAPLDMLSLAEAYNGLGASIEMSHTRLDQAVGYYAASLAAKPDFYAPFFSQIHLLGRICDWREWEAHFSKARVLIDQGASGGMGPIFALAYPLSSSQLCSVTRNRAADVEQRFLALKANLDVWHAQLWLASSFGTLGTSDPSALDKLALAVVSADLNARPVGQLVQGIFERLDKSRFEVFCFSLEIFDGSEPARRMLQSATEFQFVKGHDSRLLAEMINSIQAHVMIDLNGYTDGGRSELLPLKPAPVTVAYLGYPYTMALSGVDYTMSDRVVTPPEHYTSCFTEHLAYLPHTYMVSDHRQSQSESIRGSFSVADAKQRSLPHADEEVVLANFNHLQKLGPATFKLWTRILRNNPNSSLWLLRFPREAEPHLKRAAAADGVEEHRVFLTDKFPWDEHLRVKRAASMLLDTLEYNAHVSGLDALWAGLPLVTLAGSNMARRCGASFLQSLGLSCLLARTKEDYVRIASVLAQSGPNGRQQHRNTLKSMRAAVEERRDTSPLFDTDLWVREFERMMRTMWDTAHATGTHYGAPQPRHLVLSGHTGWASL